jgi:hypothetical protein
MAFSTISQEAINLFINILVTFPVISNLIPYRIDVNDY